MSASDLFRNGQLTQALSALQDEIRRRPDDQKLRIFLFEVDCLLGRLDKALTQLQVVASLNSDTMLMAQIFRPIIACEMLRAEVFAGKRTPLIFGEPEEWVGLLIQAATLVAEGKASAAAELRARAFEAAPATPGKVNDKPFEWIADADSRLGPLLEVILEGKYYWIPFHRIARIETAKPTDARDLVWMPAQFTWTNGGTAAGHIPTRYAGSEQSSDDGVRMARKTEWKEASPDCYLGLGQRMLATDGGEYPLLECRTVELTSSK